MGDAEACFRWVSDPAVTRMLGLLRPARSLHQERSWIASALADKEQQQVFIIADENGQAIGSCGLRGVDRSEGTAFLGIMIGERTLWNRGYGTAATEALLGIAFGDLGLQEVRLSCHADNRGALRCYEKAGFRQSSHTPDRWRFGGKEVRMAVTREEWEARDRPGADAGAHRKTT